jgi:ribosome-binding factor A
VGDLVRAELGRLLQHELRDPRLGFATVMDVVMSRDLRHARVYVSILGDAEARLKSAEALQSARGYLRRALGHALALRFVPELDFRVDSAGEGPKLKPTDL